jgi:hypothetical protein
MSFSLKWIIIIASMTIAGSLFPEPAHAQMSGQLCIDSGDCSVGIEQCVGSDGTYAGYCVPIAEISSQKSPRQGPPLLRGCAPALGDNKGCWICCTEGCFDSCKVPKR